MRTFQSPSGRRWTASLFYVPAAFATGDPLHAGLACPAVLRFRTAGLTLDLVGWPDGWSTLSDAELLALLRRARPPVFGSRTPAFGVPAAARCATT